MHSICTRDGCGDRFFVANITLHKFDVIRPVISMNFDWEETFCPDAQCWYDGLETAFAFKGYSDSSVEVNANTIIPGTIPDPGLFIDIATVDSYQPNIYTLGMQLKRDKWRLGLAVEMQEWSALEDELNNDTVKNNLGLEFDDIVIPRIGAEYYLNDTFTLTGGVAFEESPLANDVNPEVNYLDADLGNQTHPVGLGGGSYLEAYYGANAARLQKVKCQYDPTGVLAFPQGITCPSAGASAAR